VEDISTVALEDRGHTSKSLRKEKSRDEQSIEKSLVTIPQTENKKRKIVSTSDPLPPYKITTRSMATKGKEVVNPHTYEYPIDLTSLDVSA
jgi:hypothetical protein